MQNEEGGRRQVVVGVDGGGTKTLALAAGAEQGQTRGTAGSSNLHAVGFEAACAAIDSAITQAAEASEIAALCLGLAGAGRPQDVERFTAWARVRFPHTALKVVSDAEILLAAGASTGPALALICGTGSVAYGRTVRGELVRAGGWGYLFGDEGSGFAIGAAALRAVMQAYDGRAAPTLLTDILLAHYQLETPQKLISAVYDSPSPRIEIASLSVPVEQAAAQGDETAALLLQSAAGELARLVAAVRPRLGSNATPLALTGGVILHGARLAANFRQACESLKLEFTTIYEIPDPAVGAVQLARDLLTFDRQ